MVSQDRRLGPGGCLSDLAREHERRVSVATAKFVVWRRRTKRLERAFIAAQQAQDWTRTNAIAAAYARLTNGGHL